MPQVCDNCYFQTVGEPLARFLRPSAADRLVHRFVHLCHAYDAEARERRRGSHSGRDGSSAGAAEQAAVQKVTYAAMARARRECQLSGSMHAPEVEFLAAIYPEDREYASAYFDRFVMLQRTASDLRTFARPRLLPPLFDILELATDARADYIVFTNVDICPVPNFYLAVDALLRQGFDALVINRRTLIGWPIDPGLVDMMALDAGQPHEGYDCFVFPRQLLADFIRNDAVVGTSGVMMGLIYNLVATTRRLLFLGDVHLTWHLGDDKAWASPELRDYIEHNWSESLITLLRLSRIKPERFQEFCRHFPRSRVALQSDGSGRIRLGRKHDFHGFLPDLQAVEGRVEKMGGGSAQASR